MLPGGACPGFLARSSNNNKALPALKITSTDNSWSSAGPRMTANTMLCHSGLTVSTHFCSRRCAGATLGSSFAFRLGVFAGMRTFSMTLYMTCGMLVTPRPDRSLCPCPVESSTGPPFGFSQFRNCVWGEEIGAAAAAAAGAAAAEQGAAAAATESAPAAGQAGPAAAADTAAGAAGRQGGAGASTTGAQGVQGSGRSGTTGDLDAGPASLGEWEGIGVKVQTGTGDESH